MTTLHDRLSDLADGIDPAIGADAGGLWSQGQRWQRQRRAGTVVVLAATCLLLGAIGWQVRERGHHEDALLPAGSPAGLPDRVWEPSQHLPGTDSAGPPGRIALTMTADRADWRGSSSGTVAVSAETGRYSFLDLPRQADESTALSADGRHLAYWLTGTPSGSPPEGGDAITGFAVYDARTGRARIQEVETEHGLRTDTLVFADDETVVAQFDQRAGGRGDDPEDQASSFQAPLWRWDLRTGEAEPDAALTDAVNGRALDGGGHGFVWSSGDNGNAHRVVDVHDPERGKRTVPVRPGALRYSSAVDSSGQRVAAVAGAGSPNHVVWGSDFVPEQVVPGSGRTSQVLAWLDDAHLVVLRTSPGRDIVDPGVWVLDVTAGDAQELVHPVASNTASDEGSGPVLDCCASRDIAWELASEPTFRAIEPPTPIDPRRALGGGLAVLVGATIALILWRRRVRP